MTKALIKKLEEKRSWFEKLQNENDEPHAHHHFRGAKRGMDDAIDIAKEHSGWIPISERLPNENTSVLIYDESLNKKKAISTGILLFGKFVTYPSFLETLNVTHWAELPNPPSEVQP